MKSSKQRVSTFPEGNLPNGWASATIGELVGYDGVFIDGDWVESKDQDPNGDVRLTQLADIGDGTFRNRSRRYLTHDKAIELGCTFLEHGDALIARMPDPLGRTCIFPGDSKECVTVVDVCVVRTGSSGVDHSWLMSTINSPFVRSVIESLQSGSTRKRISRGNLARMVLPVPPLPEQRRIVSKMEELFTKLDAGIESLKKAQAQLKRYRQSVLKAAVEGKLTEEWREKHKGELEPASVLLERTFKERREKWEAEQLELFALKGKTPKDDKWKGKYREPLLTDTRDLPVLPKQWAWARLDAIGSIKGGITKNTKREVENGRMTCPEKTGHIAKQGLE